MVTGSSYLLSKDGHKDILIDLGLFQGPDEKDGTKDRNHDPVHFDGHNLEAVILTHAHLDHCGRLPLLVHSGFSGKIYMTRATRALTELSLYDSAHLARDMADNALFNELDVKLLLEQIVTIEYDDAFKIGPYTFTFRDAGHILGSATIEVIDRECDNENRKIVFSGDLGNYPQDLIRMTQFIDDGDVVIMESTYGDRSHPQEDTAALMQAEINHVEKTGGTLLIPSFSLERTQEILHVIDHLKKDGKVREQTPTFLDSPMSISATDIFRKFVDLYGTELIEHTKRDDPFIFPGLIETERARDSRKIWEEHGAKVIVAGSGMMTGGRIVSHAEHYLSMATTRLLFVGYQGIGTLGREILSGTNPVYIQHKPVEIRATIAEIHSMSSHADQPRLLKWLGHIKGVKTAILTHGEEESRQVLAQKVKSELKINTVLMPKMFEKVSI